MPAAPSPHDLRSQICPSSYHVLVVLVPQVIDDLFPLFVSFTVCLIYFCRRAIILNIAVVGRLLIILYSLHIKIHVKQYIERQYSYHCRIYAIVIFLLIGKQCDFFV